jgi:hypothetical protein
MAFRNADRAYETSVTTGTGDYTLDGAVTGFQGFSAGVGSANSCTYFATDDTNWEAGIGTFVTGPNRLQRTAVIASSNGGAAVNWGAGTRKIRCAPIAAAAARNSVEVRTSNTILAQTDFGKTIVVTSGTFSQTLTAAATLGDGWRCHLFNRGTGTVTVDPNGSENINGATTLTVPPGHGGWIFCDGASFYMLLAPSMDQGQIKFPATQNATSDANTLDDYEEGTFTPAITFGGAAVGVTYGTQSGNYTKIGNLVRFSLRVTLTNKGSSAGSLSVTGLPFAEGSGGVCACSIWGSNLTGTTGGYQAFVDASATTISSHYNGTGTATALSNTTLTNTSDILVAGAYRA